MGTGGIEPPQPEPQSGVLTIIRRTPYVLVGGAGLEPAEPKALDLQSSPLPVTEYPPKYWRQSEVSIPISLITIPIVFKTSLRAAAVTLPNLASAPRLERGQL